MNGKQSIIDLLIHDLTGPLAIVSTSVRGLLQGRDEVSGTVSERQRKTLERIQRNTEKARTLLQEMIEVYRCEEGLFRSEDMSVRDVLKEALLDAVEMTDPGAGESLLCPKSTEEFEALLGEKGISLAISGKYGAVPFRHDRKKVRQILRNLLTNALKHRKRIVTLSVSGDKELLITVTDDGAGIPDEKQDYVFKRFFCEKNGIANAVEGLGFGLSCVKALVDAMEGGITVTSGEGKGTSFTVRIPPL